MGSDPETAQAPAAGRVPGTVSLDYAAMGQLSSAAASLLDTLDGLRELQVGELDLPQIVVVGDRSAGKSSVLEAISRVRFPVKSGLCTRLATELVLRKAAQVKVSVAIKRADGRPPPSHQRDQQLSARWTSFDKDALPGIIAAAEEAMGFRSLDGGSEDFFKDVLHLEIAAPDVYPLTLVDLPGFFHSEAEDENGQGRDIVDQLAEGYMKQKNSIILAVVSANSPLADQTVLERARIYDPSQERTMGVVTKPDLALDDPLDQADCLALVKGLEKTPHLGLGWHVLRNRTQDKQTISADARDAWEDIFFSSGAWASVPSPHRGAKELRKRLGKVLFQHVRRGLPRLVSEIGTRIGERERRLDCMGRKPRDTTEDLRAYMLDVSDRFQRLARDGVEGRYAADDSFFGGLCDDARKLRAQLRNLHRAFAAAMSSIGTTYDIIPNDGDDDDDDDGGGEGSSGGAAASGQDGFPEFLEPFLNLYAHFPPPERLSEAALCQKLELLASVNGGSELPGAPSLELVMQLFKLQARPWRAIAAFHLRLVSDYARAFVERLVEHVVTGGSRGPSPPPPPAPDAAADSGTVAAILGREVDPFFEAAAAALDEKLDELLRPYADGPGLPLEAEFRGGMSRRSAARLARRIAGLMREGRGDDGAAMRARIEKMVEGAAGLYGGGGSFGAENAVDLMATYYEMSLRTFTDNVINLAAENTLIRNIPGILTPAKVNIMSEETLKDLAQESEETREERQRLFREVEALRQALNKCRVHSPREPIVLATSLSRPAAGMHAASGAAVFHPGSPGSSGLAGQPYTPISGYSCNPTPSPTPQRTTSALLRAAISQTRTLGSCLAGAEPQPSIEGKGDGGPRAQPKNSAGQTQPPPSCSGSSASTQSAHSGPSGVGKSSPPRASAATGGGGLLGAAGGSSPSTPSGAVAKADTPSEARFLAKGRALDLYYPEMDQVPSTLLISGRITYIVETPRNLFGPTDWEDYCNIAFLDKYSKFSPEELRLRDWMLLNKITTEVDVARKALGGAP